IHQRTARPSILVEHSTEDLTATTKDDRLATVAETHRANGVGSFIPFERPERSRLFTWLGGNRDGVVGPADDQKCIDDDASPSSQLVGGAVDVQDVAWFAFGGDGDHRAWLAFHGRRKLLGDIERGGVDRYTLGDACVGCVADAS